MSGEGAPVRAWRWPLSLRSRLFLMLLAALALAQALTFAALFAERYLAAEAMMVGALEQDVAVSVALLDRLPAAERARWVPMLERRTNRYILGPGSAGVAPPPEAASLAAMIRHAVGDRFDMRFVALPGVAGHYQAHLTLGDGAPLTIDLIPSVMPLAGWLPYVLAAQVLMLALCSWIAMRLVTRPLARLADAADGLKLDGDTPRLAETGPTEVAHAARAFNAMRDRISHHLRERVQILAAISHDLQTPITRMRLRAEVAEETPARDRLLQDLDEIEHLVQEGLLYARSAAGHVEKPTRLELGSVVESLVLDYQDTGRPVTLTRALTAIVETRPLILRRILANFIDNALKFAGSAEVEIERRADGAIAVRVLDRGPGIPEDRLEAVMQPFMRLEESRSRRTGGSGLGLAIAAELAASAGMRLSLGNREGGGTSAEVMLPER